MAIPKTIDQIIPKTTLFFIFSFTLFSLLFSLLSTPPAFAESKDSQTLRISPVIFNIPLSPGKTYTHEILLENLTDTPLPIRANLNDIQITGEEGDYTFEEVENTSILAWTSLNETTLILPPKEKKKVRMTIKTPNNIALGGYYGMIFFEPVPNTTTKATTHVVPKIGVLLLANIGVPDPSARKANIITFSTGFLHQDNTIPLLLRVKNTSLHYFTAKPILTLSPLLSLNKDDKQPIYLEEKIIFQEKIRRWEQTLNLPELQPNVYKAHLQVSTGNGQFITTDNYFIIFPWSTALLATLFLLIFLLLIWKRKRLKKTLQALISTS